ncbi:MAG: DUF935 family protein [Pseudomonadota bacterium]
MPGTDKAVLTPPTLMHPRATQLHGLLRTNREGASAQHEHHCSIDALVGRMINEGHAAPETKGTLTPIAQAIGEAQALDDIRDLLVRFADEAPDEALRDLIARLIYAARLAGETGLSVNHR